ncbi:MAG TPA: phosphatase PAP2 family protein [Pseudonocardiaceae bacterium]|nr:phosphatase PAP2 family protein [Pseudonocardiaceae bacterium]
MPRHHCPGPHGPVTDRLRPGSALGLLLTVQLSVLVMLALGFEAVLDDVTDDIRGDPAAEVGDGGELTSLDAPVSSAVIAARRPWLSEFFEVVTWAGSAAVLLPLVALAGLHLHRRTGSWRPLIFLGTGLCGAMMVSTLIKLAVARPRPPVVMALVDTVGYAFPSGHATAAAAGWLALAAALAARTSRSTPKLLLVSAAVLITGLVGLSRVYLGVHEPTDVLGGWALGALWVLAVAVVLRLLDSRHPPP